MTTDSKLPAVRLENVSKTYGSGTAAFSALTSVTFDIPQGEFVSIMGPSGCGKTTLLNLIAGLDQPSSGRVLLENTDLGAISEDERSLLRAKDLGYVFQSFNLLPRLSIWDNVAWRLDDLGASRQDVQARTREVLSLTQVPEVAWERFPSELSGGEQQRVAIARALATRPSLLLADEPTGNLDRATGDKMLALLRDLNAQQGTSVVLVTHDKYAAMYGDRTIVLDDGRLVDQAGPAPTPSADIVDFPKRSRDEQ